MKTTFFTGPPRACQRDLGHDLGAAQLAQQPVAARHAEAAAHRAADLGRHAQPVARQQGGLHALAVGQVDQQPRRAVGRRVLRAQPGQALQRGHQRGQAVAQRARQEVVGRVPAAVQRQRLRPAAQQVLFVDRPRTQGAQAVLQVDDAHGGGQCRSGPVAARSAPRAGKDGRPPVRQAPHNELSPC
jgi:hypothetical protein